MKRCFTSHVIREMNIKQQLDVTTSLLERPNFRIVTTSNVVEDVEQQEFSFNASGNSK